MSTDTYKHLILDSGQIRIGYVNEDNPGALLGATRGGSIFEVAADIRDMPADGAKGVVKGSERITKITASITVTVIEFVSWVLRLALTGASRANWPIVTPTHDEIKRFLALSLSAYSDTVALIAEISGSNIPVVLILKNVIGKTGLSIPMIDGDEAGTKIKFEAHFNPSTIDEEPWIILGIQFLSADFTYVSGELNAVFTDASTGATSWAWDFGDDAFPLTGNTKGPYNVAYASGGTKSVALTVTNGIETISITKNVNIGHVDINTLLLLQVVDGAIVEQTGKVVTEIGSVIVDNTETHDGFGSIRNTDSGSTIPSGALSIAASINFSSDLTIEGWFLRLNNSTHQTWLSSYPSTAKWQYQNWSDTVYPQFDLEGSVVATSTIPLSVNEWHHVALVRHDNVVTLYIDGQIGSSYSNSNNLSFDGIMVGDGPNGDNNVSSCCWEDIRISDKARYTGPFTPPGRI